MGLGEMLGKPITFGEIKGTVTGVRKASRPKTLVRMKPNFRVWTPPQFDIEITTDDGKRKVVRNVQETQDGND